MTPEEYTAASETELSMLPEEFRSAVSSKAWGDGHAYGYDEVLIHVKDLVYTLREPIQLYTQRIKGEVTADIVALMKGNK